MTKDPYSFQGPERVAIGVGILLGAFGCLAAISAQTPQPITSSPLIDAGKEPRTG